MSQLPNPQLSQATSSPPSPASVGYASPGTYYSRARDKSLMAWLTVAPLLIATLIGVAMSLYSLGVRLTMPYSQNPWESSILADGYRAAKGLPVYESATNPTGHATHLYGPLASQAIGVIDRVIGPSWYTGRLLSLICALGACAILLFTFADRRRPVELFICAGLLFCLQYRGRAYFVETRPDMIAVLLAAIALASFCRAHRLGLLWWYAPGIVAVMAAMLFKQTYIAAAGVPICVVVISAIRTREHDTKHDSALHPSLTIAQHALLAISPLIAFGVSVIAMKQFAPNIYYYMVTVPSLYKVPTTAILWRGLQIFQFAPLFVALGVWFTLIDRRLGEPRLRTAKMLWLIVATAIGSLAGVLAAAKRGGSYNSLLLGWIPMTAFCVAMTGPMLDRLLLTVRAGSSAIAGSCFVALIMLITTFGVPKSDLWNFSGAHGSRDFPQVVQAVKALNGAVVCPDDPMLMIFARGQIDRSLEAELDAVNRPPQLPPRLRAEVDRAEWFVHIKKDYAGYFSPEMMSSLGFRPVKDVAPFNGVYTLWQRDPAATSRPSTTRPATSRPTRSSNGSKTSKQPAKRPASSLPPEDMP